MNLEKLEKLANTALTRIARSMTPEVNRRLDKLGHKVKPQPKTYCPGCGEESSCAPDLCPECSAVNAD